MRMMGYFGKVLRVVSFNDLKNGWDISVLDLDKLPAGNYYLHLDSAGNRISKSFIVLE